jgi:hypothetical protein
LRIVLNELAGRFQVDLRERERERERR